MDSSMPQASALAAKAKTAFQSVAAKAERVLTEIRADLKADFKHVRTVSGMSSVNPEALVRVPSTADIKGELPWVAKNDHERRHEEEFRERILEIPKKPEEYLIKHVDEAQIVDMKKAMASAVAVLEVDEELGRLRCELVPKKMKEQEFWRRYFIAVKRIKQEILAQHPEEEHGKVPADEQVLDPMDEAAYQSAFQAVAIPPSMIIRRLAMATGVAKTVPTIEELANMEKADLEASQAASGDSWTNLRRSMETGLAALAARATRRNTKEEKKIPAGSQGMGEYHAFLWSLFDTGAPYEEFPADGQGGFNAERSLPEEIHGAPPHSFMAHLAEIMGGVKTEQKMARFWIEVVKELRNKWAAGEPIPHMSPEANPGLLLCLIHQKLQLLNVCMARRKRRAAGLRALTEGSFVPPEALPLGSQIRRPGGTSSPLPDGGGGMGPTTPLQPGPSASSSSSSSAMSSRIEGLQPLKVRFKNEVLYARGEGGETVQRSAVLGEVPGLTMLETGDQVYAPACQEGPVLTEDLLRETEELILRTGSVGAGCSQLFSDMQAFKAANPGCILEDFVRWYSPLDWVPEGETDISVDTSSGGAEPAAAPGTPDAASKQSPRQVSGALSHRMQAEGNLWRELWATARPVPAVKQAPLFDEELAGESALDWLLNIAPSDLFEQLFCAALGAGFAIAEMAPQSKLPPLSTCIQECRAYVAHACTRGMSAAKLERLCQVYEVMEVSVHTPPDEYNANACSGIEANTDLLACERGDMDPEKEGLMDDSAGPVIDPVIDIPPGGHGASCSAAYGEDRDEETNSQGAVQASVASLKSGLEGERKGGAEAAERQMPSVREDEDGVGKDSLSTLSLGSVERKETSSGPSSGKEEGLSTTESGSEGQEGKPVAEGAKSRVSCVVAGEGPRGEREQGVAEVLGVDDSGLVKKDKSGTGTGGGSSMVVPANSAAGHGVSPPKLGGDWTLL